MLLRLLTLGLICVEGRWDWTQDCCNCSGYKTHPYSTRSYILKQSSDHRVYRVLNFLSILSIDRKRVLPSPPPLVGGGGGTIEGERGRGEPIPTKGQTLWYSRFSIIPLRLSPSWWWRGGGGCWQDSVIVHVWQWSYFSLWLSDKSKSVCTYHNYIRTYITRVPEAKWGGHTRLRVRGSQFGRLSLRA